MNEIDIDPKQAKHFKYKSRVSLIQGKEYLGVKWRIVWFREDHPDWSIEVEIKPTPDSCLAKAVIKDQHGRIIATSHKFEDKKGFNDFIEKSETGAIGRALSLIGYGTEFAQDLDEGERIVDAPATVISPVDKGPAYQAPPVMVESIDSYVVKCGKKWAGTTLGKMGLREVEGYRDWILEDAAKKGMSPSGPFKEFIAAANIYIDQQLNGPQEDIPF